MNNMTNNNLKTKENVTINEVVLYYLHNDYEKRTHLLNNLSIHTEKLYDIFLITSDDRKKAITMINDILNQMNNYYNNCIIKINSDISNNTNNIKLCTQKELKSRIRLVDILRKNNTLDKFENQIELLDFNDIDKKIRTITNFIGMNNINDILYLYKFETNHLLTEDNQKINLFSKILIPFSCRILDNKRIDKKFTYLEFIENKELSDKYELQLNNLYILKLRTSDNKYVLEINCIIDNDTVNIHIRTSQIVYPFLYEKKQLLTKIINEISIQNKIFKDTYIKNLSLGDYLININISDLKKKITNDYCFYIKYSNMNFKTIMPEFLQVPIKVKYDMIKFLLMGNSSTINIAALLFGITKDQKDSINSNSKPTLISDIIYRNLKFSNQIKLKKSNSLIQEELDNLKNISSDDIDLKKQIIINKNMPINVKKVALNRLEELKSGSSEHYKQQLYIKKLIDFPWPNNEDDAFSLIKNDKIKFK